eukprot:TRINITY_DN464_c0_g1_i2.p1 TRINITY_DN464_c0_g1~~TRINITY_DN464_c0_g1_i2.p1  ORF type:complete len:259 (-),score=24.20 TRINITY_DN464_c0_g1_i2:226-1002(-)
MKPTRVQNQKRSPEPTQTSPALDGSWLVVNDDEGSSSGTRTPEWENCEREIVELLAPPGVTPPPTARTLAVENPPPEEDMSQEQPESTTPVQTSEAGRAERHEPCAPCLIEAPQVSVENCCKIVDRPLVASPGEEHKVEDLIGALNPRAAALRDLRDLPSPIVSEPSTPQGRFWGDVKPPSSPLMQPSPPVPPLSISGPSIPSVQLDAPVLKTPYWEEEVDEDDNMELLWQLAKYAVLIGSTLYLGSKARKKWVSSRV